MSAGNHSLGTIRGTIEIDYDGAGIVRAVRDTNKLKDSFGTVDGATNKILGAFGKFAKGGLAVSGALGLVSNGLGIVAGALAVVGPLAAAGFAAAPGVILAYVSVLAVAKVATLGVADAMGAAAEGGKKFDEAMKKLSPNAQRFVKAYQKVIPELKAVQRGMQDAFFSGGVAPVRQITNAVKAMSPELNAVSKSLGETARSTISWVTSGDGINNLKSILGGVNDFLQRVKGSLGPVIAAFIALAAQTSIYGDLVGGKLANVLASLADWLSRIDVTEVFAKAAPIIESLGSFLGDLVGIASQLFGLFATDGANAAGILAELASKLNEFLKSAAGQAALSALGDAMQAIAGAGGQIFLALLQALAPAIVALAPGVTTLATQIASVLVPAINALAPVLAGLAGFLSQNMSWLGPLAGVVVAAAAAYKVYAAAATAVAAVQGILASAMLASTLGWIRNTAALVAHRIALVASAVAMGVVRVATLAWTAVQWLLNAALTANPIGLVIVAIAALVAGIIYAYQHSETFRNIVQAVWGAIKVAIAATVNWITGTVWPSLQRAWQQIASGAQTLWGWIKAVWIGIKTSIQVQLAIVTAVVRAVWSGITAYIRGQINLVRTVISTVVNAIRAIWTAWLNATRAVARTVWSAIVSFIQGQINKVRSVIARISAVVQIVRNAFSQANNAVRDRLNAIVSLVRSLPGRVSGALGNLGGLLFGKGQALIRGFINGIASMIGAVRAKAQSVVSAVTRFLPGSPAKEGPLSGRGYVLLRARRFMSDFAQGLEDGSGGPRAAMLGAVTPLARATVSGGSTGRSGASAAPTTPAFGAGNRTYTIQLGDKALAELVVDAVSGNPVAVSKASNEGSRRTAWAGSRRTS